MNKGKRGIHELWVRWLCNVSHWLTLSSCTYHVVSSLPTQTQRLSCSCSCSFPSHGHHPRRTPDRPSACPFPPESHYLFCHGSQDLSPTQPTLRARRLPRVFPAAASRTALPETTEGCQARTTIILLFAAGRGANVLILGGLVGAWHLGLSIFPMMTPR
ncbi:hypothetical protein VDGL01_00409 [Verticillium dahliae]